MDENNQILDVTYGSFSCRLEGFEDSVETMKLVVSFFHELSGHDLFMDTEPQVPDMATLARLTEEQTGKPVDVESDGNAVSLRVRKDDADEAEVAPESVTDEDAAEEDHPIAADTQEPVEDMDEGTYADDLSSVADKLQRMRDAASRKSTAPSDEFAEDLSEPATPTPAANPLSQRLSDLVKRTADAEPVAANEPEMAQDALEEITQTPSEDLSETEADEPALTAMESETDLPSDKDGLHDDAFNVFSDLAAQDAFTDDDVEPGEQPEPQIDADVLEDTDAGPTSDAPEAEDVPPTELSDDPLEEDVELEEEEPFAMDADLEADEADSIDVAAQAFEDDTAATADEDEDDDEEDYEYLLDDAEDDENDDAAIDDEADAATSEEPPLVLTSGDEPDDDADNDDYNDDDEFDLEKEVAKVEAEIAARRGNEFARRGLPRHVEDAMSRIMSQTDQHLNQPENRRHRDAFAQLKAAVAATEAARQLGDKGADKRDPDEVYKDDLGAHDAKDKNDGNSAPPLKLVKSQEVKPGDATLGARPAPKAPAAESDDSMEAASDRLRKIATLKETEVPATADGFAEFAASHGATDLVDQMEAAGAYICFVQGEDDFSRPQVMKVVQSASNREISREDGLRSFGRLLRQARLVKLPNGRFQVADSTQYRPNGHKAAQG